MPTSAAYCGFFHFQEHHLASLFTGGRFQGFDSAGVPLSGGLLYSYSAGTLTPLQTFTTQSGGVANANPVVLDSAGRAPVWLGESSYRFILKTAAGVTITDDDNISGGGSSSLVFTPAGTGAVSTTVEAKLRESVSVLDFGADGVGDDTAAFLLAEAAGSPVIDLAGGEYSVESFWTDSVNGVLLTKNYRNGDLLVDGRPLVMDDVESFSRSGSSIRTPFPSTAKALGVFRFDQNTYYVWRPLGGQYWQRCTVSRDTTGVPFNWRETHIKQVLGYICAQDSGITYTGDWNTVRADTALSSASATAYISGRARQAVVVGDYAEISYTGGGDLYVIFTGRTSGNYVNVLLDGARDYLTLADDGAGNSYFDTYTSGDLQYKQVVKIASSVPAGSHTIRLTMSASKNASSAGTKFIFNALAFDAVEFGPWRPESDAPKWVTAQAVLQYQVRKNAGKYYYAAADGTTGATAPTHSSGSGSDGTVTWVYRATSGYDLTDHRIHAAGSQLEYAYTIKPAGATAGEDVGGSLHGNEAQTAAAIYVGGLTVSLQDGMWSSGDTVEFREELTVTHSEIGAGATPVVLTKLARMFQRQYVEIHHTHTLQMAAVLGYFYPAMWPLLHYDGPAQKYGLRTLWSPSDGSRTCADFYSQSNPFVGRTKDLLMVGSGYALQPDGAGGVPSAVAAPLQFTAWLAVDPSAVDFYKNGNRIFAAKAMNTSAADVSAGGYSSMTTKIYFERYSTQSPTSLASGSVIECHARYGLALAAPA